MATNPVPVQEGKTFLGHPRGLFVLFFAEMWERFSYYGMRAILIFYLIQHWLFSEEKSYVIYGAYTALVYITPVIGGYLADRYIGQRRAVQFGAILLVIGHGLMAFEGPSPSQFPGLTPADMQNSIYANIFWLALAFIIMGVGFLKSSISVMVGQLYPEGDIRRDPAFTIFYMGINLGAALGSLLVGYLGHTWGWSWGFGAAGVGMLLGLIVFVWGRPALLGKGEAPDPARLRERFAGIPLEWRVYLSGLVGVVVVWFLVQYQSMVGWLLGLFGLAVVLFILFNAVFKMERVERHRIIAALFLIALQPLFWSLFEQAGSSLNVFTDRHVDRTILGWEVPPGMFQSLNSIYIILLAPLFAWLWLNLAKRNLEPSTPAKFGLGLVQLGAGFLVLVAGVAASGNGMTPVIFIFLIYLLHTMGELCLSPVGLSAMTKLAPARMAGLMMGTWFLASAAGNFIGGLIASATASGAEEGSTSQVVEVYSQIGWVAIGVGVGVIVIAPLVRKLMHEELIGRTDHALAGGETGLAEPAAAGTDTGTERKP
ncbi:peptide MFS transporter [Novilysobacter defluvii]|uniref:MFS transporter n=1 Tax=Lysobacter defluvii IMMIB APB-9 = DSM 18482 TaxID=1385515 RepID=A0A0A0M8H3_9GAMM|nr:peptide MFS transporter [Lysobacter defluvii]KGO99333.1 MFS transporter [Lysobacter defluvii IMMIB APB-9 = DSM 18482]